MARVLPGRVITFGIDMMVTVIRTLDIGPTSVVAKAAEHALATGGLFITGVIAGGVLFGVLRMVDVRRAYGVGFALGAIFGIAGALITTGIVLIVHAGPPRQEASAELALVPWVGPRQLGLTGRF